MPLLKDRLMTIEEIAAALGVIADRLACIEPSADTPGLSLLLLATLTEITRLMIDLNTHVRVEIHALDVMTQIIQEDKP